MLHVILSLETSCVGALRSIDVNFELLFSLFEKDRNVTFTCPLKGRFFEDKKKDACPLFNTELARNLHCLSILCDDRSKMSMN